MDILHPWIAQLAANNLKEALDHWLYAEKLRKDVNATERAKCFHRERATYRYDGTSFRLPMITGQTVQVFGYSSFKEPVTMELSDSVSRIPALVTERALKKFQRSTSSEGRVITSLTGAMVRIVDYELVASPECSTHKVLHLYIKEMQLLGNVESPVFGDLKFIAKRPEIKKLLRDLTLSLSDPEDSEGEFSSDTSSQSDSEYLLNSAPREGQNENQENEDILSDDDYMQSSAFSESPIIKREETGSALDVHGQSSPLFHLNRSTLLEVENSPNQSHPAVHDTKVLMDGSTDATGCTNEPREGRRTPPGQSHHLDENTALIDQQIQIEMEMSSQRSSDQHTSGTLYNKFTTTYPAYKGDEAHFKSMCCRIHELLRSRKMLHKSLWDDFVGRHACEYRDHLLEVSADGSDPLPYNDFYCEKIHEPIYNKRVITSKRLIEEMEANGLAVAEATITTKRRGDELHASQSKRRLPDLPSNIPGGYRGQIGDRRNNAEYVHSETPSALQSEYRTYGRPIMSAIKSSFPQVMQSQPNRIYSSVVDWLTEAYSADSSTESSPYPDDSFRSSCRNCPWKGENTRYKEFETAFRNLKSLRPALGSSQGGTRRMKTMESLEWSF
ncbi:MAG: hypothetical protein M1819_002975 [Sarea resinae]|nr:MAG: hypothetical protein M1819_002975 [Sarea resinae]